MAKEQQRFYMKIRALLYSPQEIKAVVDKFDKVAAKLHGKFPDKLDIEGEGTPTMTGFFEVTVGGKLVHSKKKGEGYVDSDKKFQKIYDAIKPLV